MNRRYQRKLVWELKEKKLLIDSLMQGIPISSILISSYTLTDENVSILEIVDGMQRLNAIVSFVLGEFSVMWEGKECYFDPNSNNETFKLLQEEKIQLHEQLLPKEVCYQFCRKQIPAIVTGKDEATVELIFSRINSTGRKISSHDLRQSTATGEFPDLVRRVASRIRKDYTYDDHICLCDMPKISVGYERYGFGVDLNTVFWRRHDLINIPNMKESTDEEIIEALIATVLLNGDFRKSKDRLNQLYNKETKLGALIESKVSEIGKDVLEDKFAKTFDTIDMIFNSVHSDFSSFLFANERTSGKDECFKILYLAVYRLLEDGFVIYDYKAVANAIKNARTFISKFATKEKVDYNEAAKAVDNLYNVLRPAFGKEVIRKNTDIEVEIDKRLSYSKIELQMTEFKIGISTFTKNKINRNCISDIAKTLVAMANTNNTKEEGYVVVGIANNKEAFDQWYGVFKQQPVIVNQHYVPGIDAEAKKLFSDVDEYARAITKVVKSEPISSKLKDFVLANYEVVDYHVVDLLVFKSKNVGEVSLYANTKYVRQGSSTVRV